MECGLSCVFLDVGLVWLSVQNHPDAKRNGGSRRGIQSISPNFQGSSYSAGGPNPRWVSYSVGKWKADTFVVERTGINDNGGGLDATHPYTDALHLTECFGGRSAGGEWVRCLAPSIHALGGRGRTGRAPYVREPTVSAAETLRAGRSGSPAWIRTTNLTGF